MEFKRCSGILMPISSLPGGYGIGSMGKPAHDFVDFLAKAGQTIWQILPVGPTGYADSPYQSCSAFAGNPYFIDLDLLAADGLLTKKDYAAINWGGDAAHVDYGTLYEKRFAVLRKAYANFLKKRPVPGYETPYPDDWYRFRFLSSDWLPDYCLYMAIKEANGMVDWQKWPRALRVREPEALAEFKAEHAGEIEFWAFLQYEFDRQWRALHAYAKEKGVSVVNWTVDTRDWEHRNKDTILATAFRQGKYGVQDGAIVLMHDVYETSVDAAVEMMDRLTAQGYTMVTVPELIRVKGGGLQAGRFYYSGDHFKDKA